MTELVKEEREGGKGERKRRITVGVGEVGRDGEWERDKWERGGNEREDQGGRGRGSGRERLRGSKK